MSADRLLYLDWAATTPLRDEARAALLAQLDPELGNASSLHGPGRNARAALTTARRTVATLLGVERDDVVFTGNGSEANLLAVVGAARALPRDRRHVLASAIEHPSVLEPLEALARDEEIELEKIPVDRCGRVDPDEVERRLRPATGLVSVLLASHELGTLEPLAEIAAVVHRPRASDHGSHASHAPLVHTDAAQAIGKVPARLDELGVDLLTGSAHKFGGPRGVGFVARRAGVRLASPLSGGRQEQGLRGGTEDVAGAAATAAALKAALIEQPALETRLAELTALLVGELRRTLPEIALHSCVESGLPGLVNFSLPDLEGPWLVTALDQRRVAVSHGAACSSLSAIPSHVLVAIGASTRARHAVRVSMGRSSTREDVLEFVARLRSCVDALRVAPTFSSSQNRGNSR